MQPFWGFLHLIHIQKAPYFTCMRRQILYFGVLWLLLQGCITYTSHEQSNPAFPVHPDSVIHAPHPASLHKDPRQFIRLEVPLGKWTLTLAW